MKLGILIACFIFTVTAVTIQDYFTPLAKTDCCYKKKGSDGDYTLVKGTAVGTNCPDGCVYRKEGIQGSPRYCSDSRKGSLAQCYNTTTEFTGVTVTHSTTEDSVDLISFATDIGLITCTVGQSEDIACSLQSDASDSSTRQSTEGQERATETDVPFIYSTSENRIKRFSLFSEDVFINCVKYVWGWICTINPRVDYNTIYVESAEPDIDTIKGCRERCKKLGSECSFWSFSQDGEQEWGRNHDGKSECGIRAYPVRGAIPTAKGQFCGLGGLIPGPTVSGAVFVGEYFQYETEYECLHKCNKDWLCISWTFKYSRFSRYFGLCVLNYGVTQRKIRVCPKPKYKCSRQGVVVSGNCTRPNDPICQK